jgi:glyoxylase-like metal-dependent hydrolase (beta-lactamase superfamily II)
VIVERSLHPQFVSNTYLVADREGGAGFFVDAGGPVAPLLEAAERRGVTPTHVLLTHHHYDHVCELAQLIQRWPDLVVLADPREREGVDSVTRTLAAGATLTVGELEVSALHTPGHTAGMLSFLVEPAEPASEAGGGDGAHVFTGDTLFRGSVGGVRAPGHTTYADLKDSIMETLLALDPGTTIQPGHADPTTVGEEWEHNPFVRIWRGLDPEGKERCTALGQPATLVLLARDYDGGHKAWVRWDTGADDIVPGSQVERSGSESPGDQ